MTRPSPPSYSADGRDRRDRRALALVLFGALAHIVLHFGAVADDPLGHLLASPFNDSRMRLVSVRDWLAGQGWFNMTTPRVLPPDGLSLHWSRYVDLGVGGVVAALGFVAPPQRAEALALIVWPALVFMAFTALVAGFTLRRFGRSAAAIAVLTILLWRLNWNYFGPAQLDHHGPQILLLTIVIVSLVGPVTSQTRRGLLGGAAAALSLAIGLETLLPIAAAGVILAMRTTLHPGSAASQLRAFGLGLAALATLLHLGQTAPGAWWLARCDELGPAFLGLLGIAALAACVLAMAGPRLGRLRDRVALLAGVGLAAGLGAALVLRTCPGFPYGNLPPELRELVALRITEARPALDFILGLHDLAFTLLATAFCTTLIASGLFAVRLADDRTTGPERQAVTVLLVFAWIGCLGALSQIRLILLSAPAVPVLLGYVAGRLLAARASMPNPTRGSLAVLVVASLCLIPGQLYQAYRIGATIAAPATPAEAAQLPDTAAARPVDACSTAEILQSLDTLPRGRILSDLQLSTAILLVSHHDIVSAPYHRSAEALYNGTLALSGGAEDLLGAVETSRVDYVVLCRDASYGGRATFASGLARGAHHPGLVALPGLHPDLVVLRPER